MTSLKPADAATGDRLRAGKDHDASTAPSAGDRSTAATSQWLTGRRFSLLLLLLIIGSFPEVIFGAKTFLFRDYSFFGYPLAHYHREAFWRGEVPLWNPLNNSGIPYAAQWNTMVFYPLSAVYLLLPLPWSLGWFCLLHLFLAGLGMYFLAFRWTEHRLAASVAGICFAFSGLMQSFLIWPNNIAAMGWLPWVWLYVERGWTRGGVDLLKGAAIGAVQMLSGAPEIILFTWLLAGGTWIGYFHRNPQQRWSSSKRIAAIALFVAGLSAIQLLPFLDLLWHSHRSAQAANLKWSLPLWGLANFFVPLFRGIQTSIGVFLQPGQGWTSSYYLGLGTMLFAAAAVCKVRQPAVKLLSGALALSIILALGDAGGLYPALIKLIPAAGFMRFPIKFVVIAGAVVPLLAAFAVGYWRSGVSERRGLSPIVIATGFFFIIGAVVSFSFARPGADEQPHATLVNGMTRGGALVLIIGAWIALQKCRAERRFAWLLQPALLIALWLDLISHVPLQNPTVPAQAYEAKLPPLEQMSPRPKIGESRALLSWETMDKFQHAMVSNPFDAVIGFRLGLYCNCNLLEGMPKVDGFYSLYLPEEKQLRFGLFANTNRIREGLADFVGVSQLTTNFLDWEGRRSWMPMISSGQRPEFVTSGQAFDKVLAESFDPRKVVYLPSEAASRISATNGTAARIISQSVSPHRINLELDAEQPSIVVIAQSFYHLWNARIDRQAATLWRANHAFQALEIPPGRHQVELVYADKAFRAGAMISIAALVAWMGCYLLRVLRVRDDKKFPGAVATPNEQPA